MLHCIRAACGSFDAGQGDARIRANALGFGSGLTSGKALSSPRIRELFRLSEREQAVCFVNFGTVSKRKPPRIRPAAESFTSSL